MSSDVKTWLAKAFQTHLGFERPEDANEIVNYTLSLSSATEIQNHLLGFLGEGKEVQTLVRDLLRKLNKSLPAAPSPKKQPPAAVAPPPEPASASRSGLTLSQEGITVYKKKDDDEDDKYKVKPKKQNQSGGGGGSTFHMEPRLDSIHVKKKKGKGGPVERVRAICGCQARLHGLVTNCISCGRIVCTQEGAGPCFYCGTYVYAPDGAEEDYSGVPQSQVTPAVQSPSNPKAQEGLNKAQAHLEKLLEYDQNATRRTVVYDDQADYFDMSKWLSPEERKNIQEKEKKIADEREGNKNRITIDLAGRRVLTGNDEGLAQLEEQVKQELIMGLGKAPKNDKMLFNPTVNGPRPQFVATSTTSTTTGAKGAKAVIAALHHRDRVQHQFFPDVQLVPRDFEAMADSVAAPADQKKPVEIRGIFETHSGVKWTEKERNPAITWAAARGANFYLYAPKTDPGCHGDWSVLYEEEELTALCQMASHCTTSKVTFAWGVQPSQILYANDEHVLKLADKLMQVHKRAKVSTFALLLEEPSSSSVVGFRTVADAQCALINKMISIFDKFLGDEESRKAVKWIIRTAHHSCKFENDKEIDVVNFLQEVNDALDQRVSIMFTGPSSNLSSVISSRFLKKLNGFFGANRQIILWDQSPSNEQHKTMQFLNPYAGRSQDLGSFVSGLLVSPMAQFTPSKLQIGSALEFAAHPATYDATAALKKQLLDICEGNADVAHAMCEIIMIAPTNVMWRPDVPQSLHTGSQEESKWFSQMASNIKLILASDLLEDKKQFAPFFRVVSTFVDVNLKYMKYTAANKRIDSAARTALTQALRLLSRLLIPTLRSSKEVSSMKSNLFSHRIAEKQFVQEIQNEFFKYEQHHRLLLTSSSAAQLAIFGVVDYWQEENNMRQNLTDDLYDLEVYLISQYSDADIDMLRGYLNAVFFGIKVPQERPPLSTAPDATPDANVLKEWLEKLKQRQATAAKAAATLAAKVAQSQPAVAQALEEVKSPVPDMRFVNHFLTPQEEAKILKAIDAAGWDTTLSRRTQQYGYIYNYNAVNSQSRDESRLSLGPVFPGWLQEIADRLHKSGYVKYKPDQCIINEYTTGQGIKPHIDHITSFEDGIASISLGSPVVMDFAHFKTKEQKQVVLYPRSLFVLLGESRYKWSHAIEGRDSDEIDGKVVKRSRRVSLTFRKVTTRAVGDITRVKKR